MKKWIVCFCISVMACCSFSAVVSGQTQASVRVSGDGTVSLQLTDDCGGALYTVYLLKPGSSADSISNGSSDAFLGLEELQTVPKNGERYAAAEGKYFMDSSAEHGVYTAVFGGGELDGYEVRFAYPDQAAEADAVAAVNAAGAKDLAQVLGSYQNTAWALDLERDIYKKSAQSVLENMIAILNKNAVSADQVAAAYQTACVLAELKTCDTNEIYSSLFLNETILGISYTEPVQEESAELLRIFDGLRKTENMTTPDALQKVLRASEAVAIVNAATRDSVLDVLRAYNDVFLLDFDGDFKRVDTYQLTKKIEAGDSPYSNPRQVRESFENAIDALLNPGTGSGSNHNNSGGNRGGNSIISSPAVTSPDVTSDKLQKAEGKEQFLDLESAEWAKPYIQYLTDNKIIQGDGDGYFRPQDPVLREELLKMLLEALQMDTGGAAAENAFQDVEPGAWYETYVSAGVRLGVVKGMSEAEFGVGIPVSRQDAAVMIVRAAEAAGKNFTVTQEPVQFFDEEQVDEYAKSAVKGLQRAGVVNGYENGEFRPQSPITRAEASKMIYCLMKGLTAGKDGVE